MLELDIGLKISLTPKIRIHKNNDFKRNGNLILD